MAVLGWATALGALWFACAWGAAVVLGGVIVRSRADRRALAAVPSPPGPVAAGLVPRQPAPRREPRVACARTGRAAGRGHG